MKTYSRTINIYRTFSREFLNKGEALKFENVNLKIQISKLESKNNLTDKEKKQLFHKIKQLNNNIKRLIEDSNEIPF